MTTGAQYLRKASLVVANSSQALDLSALRFTFSIKQSDFQTPNTAIVNIINPSDDTISRVQKEFTRVVLQAGYEGGAFGTIFDGTIKQFRAGKSSPVEKYLTILAADGDIGLNFAVVNKTLAAGASPKDQLDAIGAALKDKGIGEGYVGPLIGGVLPRGKVLFGLARDHARRFAESNESTFSVQDSRYQVIPIKGYVPGSSVVLNSRTGLIGMPETTQEGVTVRCLLNPAIKIGSLLQIDNKSINSATVREQGFPQFTNITFFASESADGSYRVLVAEHEGDTRGNEWYSDLICLAVAGGQVQG